METVTDVIFLGSKVTGNGDCSHEIKNHLLLGRKAMTNLDSILKSRDITLLTKVRIVKAVVFLSSHVWMWNLDHKEGWVPKNWCLQTVVPEKTLESPLDCKKIKPVNPKGNQTWIFIERTDAEAPKLWPSDAKSWLMGKDPDVGKDWGQESEMVDWHQWLNGHKFEQEIVKDREACCAAVHGVTKNPTCWATEQQQQQQWENINSPLSFGRSDMPPQGAQCKESTYQCRKHRFEP